MTDQNEELEPLLAIGFWLNPLYPDLPTPQTLVAPFESESERSRVVEYLRGGSTIEVWRGWSHCRFDCGVPDEEMGHADLSDGIWVWPEGLVHYIARHGVVLPNVFVEHARSRDFVCPTTPRVQRAYATEPWITWARQHARPATDI